MCIRDSSGTVIEVGEEVKHFKPGDEVYSMRFMPGVYGQYALVPENEMALKPVKASHEEAAALTMAGTTAIKAFDLVSLKQGEDVLIVGSSGGVGHLAVQIAKIFGAKVTAVCSTRNIEFVKSLGADDVIDYTKENYLDTKKKFDVVFITVSNGQPKPLGSMLAEEARVISIDGGISLFQLCKSRLLRTLKIPHVSYQLFLDSASARRLRIMADWFDKGQLQVEVEKTFSLEDLQMAFAEGRKGKNRGKIVLTASVGAKQDMENSEYEKLSV